MLEGLFDQKELVLLLETARSDPAFHEQALGLDDGSGGIRQAALWYTAGTTSTIFIGYFVGVVIFGLAVAAFSKSRGADSYFLASKKLPWYAVGASFVASNISTEHFIGMIGWAYLYGMAVSH